ncbi:MAG: preprotein translocase subunit SecD, partial [Planctomycetota bacterium]
MQRNTNMILAISLLAVALCLYLAAPASYFVSKEGDPKPLAPNSGIVLGLDLQGGASIEFAPVWSAIEDKQEAKRLQADSRTLDDIVEITQQRIDIYGLQEMKVRRAENRVRVELPGADQRRAQEIIDLVEQAGRLEFRIVADNELKTKYPRPKAPNGYAWLPYRAPEGGVVSSYELLKIDDNYRMTGADISDASVGPDQFGGNMVLFSIRPQSQQTFGSLTGDNIGKNMAIVLDGFIQSAPVIKGQITDNGSIEGGQGGFAMSEAQRIVTVLKSGRLPVPLKAENQNVIGPSLGADAIQAGIIAGVVGTLAVVAIMCLYYFGMGVLSTIGLVVAMALVVGVLAGFNATLTLSGIAGLVLTLG